MQLAILNSFYLKRKDNVFYGINWFYALFCFGIEGTMMIVLKNEVLFLLLYYYIEILVPRFVFVLSRKGATFNKIL